MHADVALFWQDVGMNTMIAEMNIMTVEEEAPSKADSFAASEPLPRLPVAAGLLPYGLSLESLLRP